MSNKTKLGAEIASVKAKKCPMVDVSTGVAVYVSQEVADVFMRSLDGFETRKIGVRNLTPLSTERVRVPVRFTDVVEKIENALTLPVLPPAYIDLMERLEQALES